MKTQHTTNAVVVKMIFDRWNGLIKQFDAALDAITDEQLQREVFPGKNRGIYLLGHLIAVHDDMLRLLDMGEKLYPELYETFIKMPDKAVAEIPSAQTLRVYWKKQTAVMAEKFNALQADEWFEKHTAVIAEDFANEPHRNKLNIILTRVTHLAHHEGQFILLK
jgi:hypothetical protein